MPKVFISYASGDKYFVDLLARLLLFHHIDIWNYVEKIHVGSDYKEDINKGLQASDYLIAVVSSRSGESKWVTREISTFQAMKEESKIIPLILENVDADKIYDGLRNIHSINMYENMLTGFQQLLKTLGVEEFLPVEERRKGSDRRVSSVAQRLRFGIWKAYEIKTGTEKFERIQDLPTMKRIKVMDSIQEELAHYEAYTPDGQKHMIAIEEIDEITYTVWEELSKREYATAFILIEAIADEIMKRYELRMFERREANRKSTIPAG
jgi:hypothetical protein